MKNLIYKVNIKYYDFVFHNYDSAIQFANMAKITSIDDVEVGIELIEDEGEEDNENTN